MTAPFQSNSAFIKLDDDMPVVGRWFYAGLALLLVSIVVRVLSHKDTNLIINLSVLVALGPASLWFIFLASWRKSVRIDKLRKMIEIRSGFIKNMFEQSYSLNGFSKIDIDTKRSFVINVGGAPGGYKPDKITKKFYFSGKTKLLIAKRCYSSNDRVREASIKKLEYELRDVIQPKS
mgnify:CR=1 FL=1